MNITSIKPYNMNTQTTHRMNFMKKPSYQKPIKEGKKILLQDILTYIRTNDQIIGKPEIFQLNDVQVIQQNPTITNIDQLYANKKSTLSALPKNLQNIFGEFCITRTGVLHSVNVPKNVDISFFSCLFEIFFADNICNESEKKLMIEDMIRKLYMEAKNKFTEFNYRDLGWNQREFIERVKNCSVEKDIYRYCADFLYINIFILDLETDSLYYAGPETYNPYKKNVFILRFELDHFEPLYFNDIDTYIPSNTTHIVQKLINNTYLVEYMNNNLNSTINSTQFSIGVEQLDKYISRKNDNMETVNPIIRIKDPYHSKESPPSKESFASPESIHSDGNEFIEELSDSYELHKSGAINPLITSNEEKKNDPIYDRKVLEKKTLAEIRTIADNNCLAISFKNAKGCVTKKTKKQLIDQLLDMYE